MKQRLYNSLPHPEIIIIPMICSFEKYVYDKKAALPGPFLNQERVPATTWRAINQLRSGKGSGTSKGIVWAGKATPYLSTELIRIELAWKSLR